MAGKRSQRGSRADKRPGPGSPVKNAGDAGRLNWGLLLLLLLRAGAIDTQRDGRVELETTAAGTAEQQVGESIMAAEEPNWRDVKNSSLELLERSRDLRLVMYLCIAQLKLEGMEGLCEGLGLHLAFAATRMHKRGELGNAILSRFPISAISVLDISLSRIERRGVNRRFLGERTVRSARPTPSAAASTATPRAR